MARLVALLFGQITEIDDLMTIRHPHRGDQTQRPEKKTRNCPAVAVARLLSGNGFREAGANQMSDQHHDQGLEFHGKRAARPLR